MVSGSNASIVTPKPLASITSSASDTHRFCASIFAIVSRSMSQPIR